MRTSWETLTLRGRWLRRHCDRRASHLLDELKMGVAIWSINLCEGILKAYIYTLNLTPICVAVMDKKFNIKVHLKLTITTPSTSAG